MRDVFILGGYQTDFAYNWSKNGHDLFELLGATVTGGLEAAKITPGELGVAHIGNLGAELFSHQGHLGGLLASVPGFSSIPAMRHEAACASGSMAVLAASADIESGRYDVAMVLGVEQMRTVPGKEAAAHLGVAAWWGKEEQDADFLWPSMFSKLGDLYEERHGLDRAHLTRIAEINLQNARNNPRAQTRGWTVDASSFAEDDTKNPVIEGRIRRYDCGQITDGGACVFLASERAAKAWALGNGRPVSRLAGWGHQTAPMLFSDKIERSRGQALPFPHIGVAVEAALNRAGLSSIDQLDGAEVHDCFTTTEYMIIDHLGLTPPGRSFEAIEDGSIEIGGRFPINPSGGLIGAGHPIGATGVRMLLDAHKQVTGQAEAYQVDSAGRILTLNIGGSTTTVAAFVVEK